ncbi:MAG: hypothetical protein ACR2O1_03490 [Boseongicola sp.]
MYRILYVVLAILIIPGALAAQDKSFRLSAPENLVETGFLKHLLPRFSLKTGVRITVVTQRDVAEAALGAEGVPVFKDQERLWQITYKKGPHTDRFAEWLLSDVGRRTIEAFQPDGTSLFSADVSVEQAVVNVSFEGDAATGEALALSLCGRCHVVNEKNRMNGIGSTPSFGLLRTFADWDNRFQSFFALNPHPSFTQVLDVTQPFSEERPPPIEPLKLTLEDLEAILAFVSAMEPANLGAPIQSQ